MPSTFTQNYYHTVFSTKLRSPLITPELEQRRHPFIGGIVRDLRCQLLAINGIVDHVHLLIRYRPDLSHSEMLQHIKGRSSKWVNESVPQREHFSWQEGYAGFTVSASAVAKVEAYIANHTEHHKRQDFRSELLELLKKHDIEFDENDAFR